MKTAWNIEAPIGEELRHLASHSNEKLFKPSYEAVPPVKINVSSSCGVSKLEDIVSALQKIMGGLIQILMVIVIVGFLFHVLGSLTGSRLRGMHGHQHATKHHHPKHHSQSRVSHPSNPHVIQRLLNEKTKLDKEKIGLAKDMEELMKADSDIDQKIKELSEASDSTPGSTPKKEITEILTSRYNHDYFCTIKRSRRTGESGLAIDFILVGDRSLGNLQDPMASTIFWEGGSVHAAKHTYEVDDLQHEVVEGTLLFDGIPKGKTLDFAFGSFGYSKVRLPVVLDAAASSQSLARPSIS
jgi:hypothetical protein|mmetsp:Transcript_6409/g.10266  ORF Transcript_6409/g.10266 Transcript_6409/m.10266 type:complete len:298 (-) Transcript_6409:48-941(-)